MGTRNLTVVVVDKKVKVAQYCQWDGYLSGQGQTILSFIKNTMKLRKFKKAVRECRFIDKDELRSKWVEAGDDPKNDSGLVGMDISDKFKELFPALHRDFGGDVLEMIQDGTFRTQNWKEERVTHHKIDPVRELWNDVNFAAGGGGFFGCEYAYALDLDRKVLEIYAGYGGEKGKHLDLPCLAVVPFAECGPELVEKLEAKEQELAG